jgi:predicted phage-related endonuclease
MKNIDSTMRELAQYTRIMEEASDMVDGLKDEIKRYMEEHETDILIGNEHKATYKAVTFNRIDTAALKKDLPDIAAQYTKTTETKRFTFQ